MEVTGVEDLMWNGPLESLHKCTLRSCTPEDLDVGFPSEGVIRVQCGLWVYKMQRFGRQTLVLDEKVPTLGFLPARIWHVPALSFRHSGARR